MTSTTEQEEENHQPTIHSYVDREDAESVNSSKKESLTTVTEGEVRPSIAVKLIRHAESANNQMYRDARYIYRGGTPQFDEAGWNQYIDTHRKADPAISDIGRKQAQRLAEYLVPHLANQASKPVRIITSPMRRTLETIRPTLHGLANVGAPASVLVNAFYHESEGCHSKEVAEEGMNPDQIKTLLMDSAQEDGQNKEHVLFQSFNCAGFPNDPERGWYNGNKGAETRVASEVRAAKFYCWLCEFLDEQLQNPDNNSEENHDVFDASVAIPGEEDEDEHDKMAHRKRKRRTCILMGHGDFMSLVLKRVVAGFGHYVEQEGIPHRASFVHFNTGITELEYFGHGRFLIMAQNHTPHFKESEYSELRAGGSLKDGWSYLVPSEHLYSEVKVAFDDELDEHVREQAQALKALYLKSGSIPWNSIDSSLEVEEQTEGTNSSFPGKGTSMHFIVHRGLQVVGCATYSDETGKLTDVAIKPSVGPNVMETLLRAVKAHTTKLGRSGSLLVYPRTDESKKLFEQMGLEEVDDSPESMNH